MFEVIRVYTICNMPDQMIINKARELFEKFIEFQPLTESIKISRLSIKKNNQLEYFISFYTNKYIIKIKNYIYSFTEFMDNVDLFNLSKEILNLQQIDSDIYYIIFLPIIIYNDNIVIKESEIIGHTLATYMKNIMYNLFNLPIIIDFNKYLQTYLQNTLNFIYVIDLYIIYLSIALSYIISIIFLDLNVYNCLSQQTIKPYGVIYNIINNKLYKESKKLEDNLNNLLHYWLKIVNTIFISNYGKVCLKTDDCGNIYSINGNLIIKSSQIINNILNVKKWVESKYIMPKKILNEMYYEHTNLKASIVGGILGALLGIIFSRK